MNITQSEIILHPVFVQKILEKIVIELENGELNLDESISKFEEGIKISKECNKILVEYFEKIRNDNKTKS